MKEKKASRSKEAIATKQLSDKIKEFKDNSLNVNCNYQRGMAENEDIFFQSVEARNGLYDAMPDIVNDYMGKINKLTGKDYKSNMLWGFI